MKKCTKCGELTDNFSPNKRMTEGLASWCRDCINKKLKEFVRTKIGLAKKIYRRQKFNSIKRGHRQPAYTKEDFIEWILNNSSFNNLYEKWVASDFKFELIPSCDRLDNSVGYSFSNIQVVTWEENRKNSNISRRRKVKQFDINGNFIKEYISLSEAFRITHTNTGNIHSCCLGKRKQASGYKWKYKSYFSVLSHSF
ncbi:MAG: NUMOD1 domain-containing DNA-binding protein [Nanoarchaeota archaeon]|jgi:hypothetical protein|nr:NUMOD1 domain-containing DNA-binding protein [Nanoarchaeota archaeon]